MRTSRRRAPARRGGSGPARTADDACAPNRMGSPWLGPPLVARGAGWVKTLPIPSHPASRTSPPAPRSGMGRRERAVRRRHRRCRRCLGLEHARGIQVDRVEAIARTDVVPGAEPVGKILDLLLAVGELLLVVLLVF